MAIINVLDKHTQELIAAGEVVERPASVAKELLENAIDAGSTAITISIENGGIRFLQVSDNGSGIESEYLQTAFVRHATSKIKSGDDLFNISTLGFRGEALPSIASVAKVSVLTRTNEDEFASCFTINGGENGELLPGARAVGTTITVRDLFYNTPARMKFLKKDSSEAGYVAEVVARTAISHPEVAIEFIKDGKTQFITAGDNSLKSAVSAVLSKPFANTLIPIVNENGIYKVSGYITSPSACRASRSMQFFYLNGRYVKNKTIMAALEGAFKGTLMQGKFPGCVLFLQVPPHLVDVNVHPAKIEVRFSRESDVFDAVYAAVKGALCMPQNIEKHMHLADLPSVPPQKTVIEKNIDMTLNTPLLIDNNIAQDLHTDLQSVEPPKKAEVFRSSQQVYKVTPHSFNESVLDIEPKPIANDIITASNESKSDSVSLDQPAIAREENAEKGEQLSFTSEVKGERLTYIGELFQTYILAQFKNELCLIDKHAAHERIIYENIASNYGNVPSQMLLKPIAVDLSAAEKSAILNNLKILVDAGFEVDDFGGNALLLRSIPADVKLEDPSNVLVEIAQRFVNGAKDALNERTEWVLHSVSCRAAMKAGDRSNALSLLAIAEKVLRNEIPPFCPHGRPVILRITQKEIEKQFGRIV